MFKTNPISATCLGDELQQPRPLHELTAEQLDEYFVTPSSQFRDVKWSFKNLTHGSPKAQSNLNWDMTLLDGTQMTDVRHTSRLRWAKLLMLSVITLPTKGRAPSPGSYSGLQTELTTLLSWMSVNGFQRPEELTPTVIASYIETLPAFVCQREHADDDDDEDDDEGIGVSVFDRALNPLVRLWEQRAHLALFGVTTFDEHPLGGNGAHSIALKLATRAQGWVMPLPDEVCIPLFNTAAWWLGAPARDVIKLLGVFSCSGIDERLEGNAKKTRLAAENAFLDEFIFSAENGKAYPWRESIGIQTTQSGTTAMAEFRQMYESVRDAANVMIQGTTGMRVSELCGLQAGIDAVTGLPTGVRLEQSITGLYEWFVIRSELSKTKEGTPKDVDWVLGMRPMGSADVPIAVQAIVILNKLYAPWRTAASVSNLILGARVSISLPRPSTCLGAFNIGGVLRGMKRFIERRVDLAGLPDESARKVREKDLVRWRESKGRIFTTHMLRKSWANFTLACDSRLLPAIQMQFHHMSLAMTEGGYIGNNPVLLETLDSMSKQRTNRSMYDLVVGNSAVAGRMGAHLEVEAEKLRGRFSGLPPSERWTKTAQWVAENQVQMFFSTYATCVPLKRSEMRCHESETPIWIRHAPNPSTREPSVCSGCANAVMDSSHRDFWTNRHVAYAVTIALEMRLKGSLPAELRVIEFRAMQSLAILKKMGADMEQIASLVEEASAQALGAYPQ